MIAVILIFALLVVCSFLRGGDVGMSVLLAGGLGVVFGFLCWHKRK